MVNKLILGFQIFMSMLVCHQNNVNSILQTISKWWYWKKFTLMLCLGNFNKTIEKDENWVHWRRVVTGEKGWCIGTHMHMVYAANFDWFYLQLLLHDIRWPNSFLRFKLHLNFFKGRISDTSKVVNMLMCFINER